MMENVVYERDYAEEFAAKDEAPLLSYSNTVFEETRNSGIIDSFKEKVRDLPRIVIPEDRANFEYLLPRLDALAEKMGGSIHAEINYQRWDSSIDLILPFLEFFFDSDYELFRDLATKTSSFNVTATEDGNVRVHIAIDYFAEVGMDAQQRRDYFDAEIEKRPDLKAMRDAYRLEETKLELQTSLGIPAAMMNEDMVWLISYARTLSMEEMDATISKINRASGGDQNRFLDEVRRLRAMVDGG